MKIGSVFSQVLGRVAGWINGDQHRRHLGPLFAKQIKSIRHVRKRCRANIGTVGVTEVDHQVLPPEVLVRDCSAGLINKREWTADCRRSTSLLGLQLLGHLFYVVEFKAMRIRQNGDTNRYQCEGDPTQATSTGFGIRLVSSIDRSLFSGLGFNSFVHALEPRYYLGTELHYRYGWP